MKQKQYGRLSVPNYLTELYSISCDCGMNNAYSLPFHQAKKMANLHIIEMQKYTGKIHTPKVFKNGLVI